jgi:hypothetical protein
MTADDEHLTQSDPATAPARRCWLQFSLRSMLVLVVLAAIGFSLWTSNQRLKENRRLHAENKKLKNELGELTIEDGNEHKLHAIQVPNLESTAWKWRIHVPKGRKFQLHAKCGTISATGEVLGSGLIFATLHPGEALVTAALVKNTEGKWEFFAEGRSGNSSSSSRGGLNEDIVKLVGHCTSSSSGVGSETIVAEPGDNLTLLKYRMYRKNANGKNTFDGPGDAGISVVIKEAK